jgi:hypothetical protein
MTKTDRLVAEVLRYCDAHTDNHDEEMLIAWVAEKFAEHFAADRPRFDREQFMRAALHNAGGRYA